MSRHPDHPVEPLFTNRWSPRSFTGEPIPDEVLLSAFEAARWAPSAMNAQPWRFLVARPGEPAWQVFLDLLLPRNRLWAGQASALIVVLSSRQVEHQDRLVPNVSHSFDTGAAWASLALQALLLGWHTHGIGGFDHEAARARLGIPESFAAEAMVAIGKRGDPDGLPADFRAREVPSGRRPLAETVFAGSFNGPSWPCRC